MNSEHINMTYLEKLNYIEENYCTIEKNNGYWQIEYLGEIFRNKDRSVLVNKFIKIDELYRSLKMNNIKISNQFFKNGILYFTTESTDGDIRNTSIIGYNNMKKASIKFQEEINKNSHILLSEYKNAKEKVLIDYNCGHEPSWITPNEYLKGKRCPICSHNIIKPYVNDVYTKRPDLLKYFINPKDAIGQSIGKNRQLFKCPTCGSLKEDTISNIASFGFSCPICSDGISYSEKILEKILQLLDIKYIRQAHFDWCKFHLYQLDNKIHIGVYDFYLVDYNLLIEMDGAQHYSNLYFNIKNKLRDFNVTKEIDKHKTILAKENGYNLIRIDCNYKTTTDRFKYIKDNIIFSLDNIIDLSAVDWDIVFNSASTSKMKEVWDLWDKGYYTFLISDKVKLSNTTIIKYLIMGAKTGNCSYTKEESKRRKGEYASIRTYKYVKAMDKDSNIVGVFWNQKVFVDNYKQKYNKSNLNYKHINYVLRGEQKSTSDLFFKEISKEEYELLLKNEKIVNDNGEGLSFKANLFS